MAMAGKTWPPVPPPAINNFTDLAVRSSGHDLSRPYLKSFPFASAFARSFGPRLLRNIEADAREAAGTDSDERLRELKAGALRVHVRMKKYQQASLAVTGAHDEKKERGDRCGKTGGEPLPRKAGDKKYRGGDENDVHGCAE